MRTAVRALVALILIAVAALAYPQLRALQMERAELEKTPGPVDIGFAQFMSLHHQQAIGMAQLMLDGRPTSVGPLARAMADTQLLELGEMRGWLRLWNQALLPTTRSMNWMLAGDRAPGPELTQYLLDCQRSPTGMTGLATDAEVNRLRELSGAARDEYFLRLMLAHHEGGLPMAGFAAEQGRLAVVRRLAARIVLEQSHEVQRFRHQLAVLDAVRTQKQGGAP